MMLDCVNKVQLTTNSLVNVHQVVARLALNNHFRFDNLVLLQLGRLSILYNDRWRGFWLLAIERKI